MGCLFIATHRKDFSWKFLSWKSNTIKISTISASSCNSGLVFPCNFSLEGFPMASNGAKQSLLSALVNPSRKMNNAHGSSNRKRFPSVAYLNPELLFGKFHLHFWELGVALATYLGVGTMCFYSVLDEIKGNKENPVIDSLYFTVTTLTTIGYGDLVPNSPSVKMHCCVFVMIGMALMGLIMSKAADYIAEKQGILLVKALSEHKKYGPFKITNEMETSKTGYRCLLATGVLSILMSIAIIFLHKVEELNYIDAIYCVFTTITTVGYGDKAFATNGGRIFAIFWILISTFGLGQFSMYIVEVFTERRQRALANWVANRMTNLNLDAADDGVAEVAEFAVNKLKQMGKISQEDITCLMKEFEELDVHHCGLLLASDLVFAQTKR